MEKVIKEIRVRMALKGWRAQLDLPDLLELLAWMVVVVLYVRRVRRDRQDHRVFKVQEEMLVQPVLPV